MNEPVRIVADWLKGTTSGSTSVMAILALTDFPKDSGDTLPTLASNQFYDSTRHGWAARRTFPRDGSVNYPCVMTDFGGVVYDFAARKDDVNARIGQGVCTVTVYIAARVQATETEVTALGYLTRAVLGSLYRLNKPETVVGKRERNGFQLALCQSIVVAPFRTDGEDIIAGTQITLTYLSIESTPD